MKTRKAVRTDAEDLAYLINIAGEGIPEYLWSAMAGPGESAMDVGVRRAAGEEGGFSYTNATVAEDGGHIMGMILDYRLPDPYDADDLRELPAVIRPLIELESLEPGSWYVNAVATFEPYRGRGVATSLLGAAEDAARAADVSRMSIIVARENTAAHGLYEKLGYRDKAARPIVQYHDCEYEGDWVLMVKDV